MEENREEFIVPGFDAAFEKLHEPGHFLYGANSGFGRYVSHNPLKVDGMILTMVDTGATYSSNIPLTKHSPFTILFDRGIYQLKQNGALDLILKRWMSDMPKLQENPTKVISIFDASPAMICMFSIAGFTVLLFLLEVTVNQFCMEAGKLMKSATNKSSNEKPYEYSKWSK